MMNPGNTRFSECDGALLDNRHVIMAAHCISGRNGRYPREALRVYVGKNHKYQAGGIGVGVQSIILHGNYNPNNPSENDLAILRLDTVFQFTQDVVPACLPTANWIRFSNLSLASWSNIERTADSSQHLRQITVHSIDGKAHEDRKYPQILRCELSFLLKKLSFIL